MAQLFQARRRVQPAGCTHTLPRRWLRDNIGQALPTANHPDANFGGSSQLTDTGVIALAKHCAKLTSVNFSLCGMLTDTCVITLAEHCAQLTSVNFSFCDHLTDASVFALAEHCSQLTRVDFGYGEQITDASVIQLAVRCPFLYQCRFWFQQRYQRQRGCTGRALPAACQRHFLMVGRSNGRERCHPCRVLPAAGQGRFWRMSVTD